MSSQSSRSSTSSKGTPTPKRPTGRGNRPAARGGNRTRTLVIAGAVAALVVVALLVALLAGGDDTDETATGGDTPVTTGDGGTGGSGVDGTVTVEGDPLTPHGRGSDIEGDPGIGEALPTISGTDLDGQPMTIAPDGKAKLIVVMAHWCPHCQAEVPRIVDWRADGGLPDGMELIGVATANAENRPNYPAKDWLEREDWDAPTLLDDENQDAAVAVGTSAYPFLVVTDADGTVVARTSGELTADQLDDLVALAAT